MYKILILVSAILVANNSWANPRPHHNHGHGHGHSHGAPTPQLPYSDLLQASEILSRSYTGNQETLVALEVSRDLASRQVSGSLMDRSASGIVAISFVCPRANNGSVTSCTQVRPARRVVSQKIAEFREAMIAIAEELTDAGGNANAIQALKAYSLRRGGHDVIWVRATLRENAAAENTFANFSCHEVSHGDRSGMHCHFINTDATGPEEPLTN